MSIKTRFMSKTYIGKEQNFAKVLRSYAIESCLLWHIFP